MFFAAGDNTLDVPLDAVALTLVPPASNAAVLTLKGSSGDTGIVLHATHPSSIAIDPLAPIILNVDIDVEGVRLIWT
jgi:hypothetical protein